MAGQAITRMGELIAASCDLDALLALARSAADLPGPAWDPARPWLPPTPADVPHRRRPGPARRGRGRGGLYLRLHRASRAARGGRVAGGLVRSAARRGPARRNERADPRRRIPRAARGRALRQRAAARPGGRARPPAARRSPPNARACSTWGEPWTGCPCAASWTCRPRMTQKLTLGYRTATAITDSVLARTGERVRGHEFHRTATAPPSGARAAWRFSSGALEGHVAGAGRRLLPAHALGRSPGRGVQVRRRLRGAALAAGTTPMKRLIGVGVGPGDPELVTVKAVRVLREADVVLVPVLAAGPQSPEPGRAETIIRAYVDADKIKRLEFALNDTGGVTPRRAAAWRAAGRRGGRGVRRRAPARSRSAPWATPTCTPRSATWRRRSATWFPAWTVQTVAGITAMQDLASRARISLAEGTEPVTLVPLNGGVAARWTRRWPAAEPSSATRSAPRPARPRRPCGIACTKPAAWTDAVIGARPRPPRRIHRPRRRVPDPLRPRRPPPRTPDIPYLSTLIVPVRRPSRGSLPGPRPVRASTASDRACGAPGAGCRSSGPAPAPRTC